MAPICFVFALTIAVYSLFSLTDDERTVGTIVLAVFSGLAFIGANSLGSSAFAIVLKEATLGLMGGTIAALVLLLVQEFFVGLPKIALQVRSFATSVFG